MLSIIEPQEAITAKNKKLKAKNKLSFMNNKLGENFSNPTIKTADITIVTNATRVKQVFIFLSLFVESGKYLISPEFKPNNEKDVINPITDIIVVANPISCALNNLAHINQKTNPRTAITPELNIRNIEFLNRESFIMLS